MTWAYYVGAGLGNAEVEYNITSRLVGSDSDSALAYQLGLWVAIPMGTRGNLDVGYRWLTTKNEPNDADVYASLISVRYRWHF